MISKCGEWAGKKTWQETSINPMPNRFGAVEIGFVFASPDSRRLQPHLPARSVYVKLPPVTGGCQFTAPELRALIAALDNAATQLEEADAHFGG